MYRKMKQEHITHQSFFACNIFSQNKQFKFNLNILLYKYTLLKTRSTAVESLNDAHTMQEVENKPCLDAVHFSPWPNT